MSFTFNVMTTSGQKIPISSLGPDNTILDVKAKVEEVEGVPQSMVMLVHAGRRLLDQDTLSACGIRAGVTINMVVALRAG